MEDTIGQEMTGAQMVMESLVREGVAWFASFGSASLRLLTTVAPITYAAGFNSAAPAPATAGCDSNRKPRMRGQI